MTHTALWIRCLLAALSGATVTLSLAPWTWWPLGAMSAATLLWLWHSALPQHILRIAWCYGFGFFGAGISWVYVSIHEFGNASAPFAAFLTALFCALLALLFVIMGWVYRFTLSGKQLDATHILGFTGLWVLNEWIRTWFLTGFPWVFLGYGYIDTPLAGFAPIGGVFLLSFMACAITCTFATGLIRNSKPLIGVSLGLALTSAIAGHTLSSVEWTAPRGETRSVAIVQPNTPQELKWNPRYYQQILSNLERLNAQAASGDIIIWPEAAVPRYLHNAEADLESIKNRAGELNQALITGIPFANRALKQSHNSITVLSGGEGLYHKQRLVPFGEYVPLEFALRGLIDFFDLPMSSFSKGKPFQSPLWAQGQIISPSICYEVVYPDFVARNARASDWLLTISNDSWFGDSIGPIQHLQMAQMRALETQRYLVRGTSNGISAIINERGAIQAQTEQFVATVLRGEVESRTGSTPFMQAGSTPIIVLSLIALLYARRRNPTSAN